MGWVAKIGYVGTLRVTGSVGRHGMAAHSPVCVHGLSTHHSPPPCCFGGGSLLQNELKHYESGNDGQYDEVQVGDPLRFGVARAGDDLGAEVGELFALFLFELGDGLLEFGDLDGDPAVSSGEVVAVISEVATDGAADGFRAVDVVPLGEVFERFNGFVVGSSLYQFARHGCRST